MTSLRFVVKILLSSFISRISRFGNTFYIVKATCKSSKLKMASGTKQKKPVSTSVSFVAGFISGAIECTVVWPMEYIKTQLQLTKPPYTGVLSGLKYTVRTTGFFSLYNGLGVTLVCLSTFLNLLSHDMVD